MKNETVLYTSKRISNVLDKVDSNVSFKELIDAGILNKKANGNIIDKTIGPIKMVVGQMQKVTHREDKDFSRLIQVTIRNPSTGELEIDDINNYLITMPEDSLGETYITKIKDERQVSLHDDEVDTYFTVSCRESMDLYSGDFDDIRIMNDMYIIKEVSTLSKVSPEFGIKFAFCLENRALYEWKSIMWERCLEPSGEYNSKFNHYDKISHIEYKTMFTLNQGEDSGLNFPATDITESILYEVKQYDNIDKKLINEYEVSTTKTSIRVKNNSPNRCTFSVSVKVSYEIQFAENIYDNLTKHFVLNRQKPSEANFVFMEINKPDNIDFINSTI